MLFGLMVKKCGIISQPLTIKMQKVKLLICSIGCLCNFCINKRLLEKGNTGIYCPKNTALSPEEVVLHERAANYEGRELTVNCEAPYSNNRERVVAIIESYGYTREGAMGNHNRKRTRELLKINIIHIFMLYYVPFGIPSIHY